MDVRMLKQMTQPNEMKNHQIKWAGVDGTINKQYYRILHQGEVFREKFPCPLLSGSLYTETIYMLLWIWLE